mmetsp:Transcript_16845/g.24209  ORF Transcript_16845/g.24209 Transcript_16845/m.24209 type:complete len:109 (-) Transcript_16845:164-490(-)
MQTTGVLVQPESLVRGAAASTQCPRRCSTLKRKPELWERVATSILRPNAQFSQADFWRTKKFVAVSDVGTGKPTKVDGEAWKSKSHLFCISQPWNSFSFTSSLVRLNI